MLDTAAAPAAIPSTTTEAEAVPTAAAGDVGPTGTADLLEALAPKGPASVYRVHRVTAEGGRGGMVMSFPISEEPGKARERIRGFGAGEYEICLVENGRYTNKSGRMAVAPGECDAPAAAPAASVQAAGFDPRVMLDGFASIMREGHAATSAMIDKMQAANVQAQLDMAKLMLANKPASGGEGSGVSSQIMDVLIARALEKPEPPPPPPSAFAQLKELLQVQKLIGGKEEENPLMEAAKGLTPILAGLMMQSKAEPPRQVRTVSAVSTAPPAPAAPTAQPAAVGAVDKHEKTSAEQFAELVNVVEKMAARNIDSDSAIVTLTVLLEPEYFQQVTTLVTLPGALDQLLTIAPSLAPYRAWLEALAEGLRANETQQADPNASPDT